MAVYHFPLDLRDSLESASNQGGGYPCVQFVTIPDALSTEAPQNIWMYTPPGFALGDVVTYDTVDFGLQGGGQQDVFGGKGVTVDGAADIKQAAATAAGKIFGEGVIKRQAEITKFGNKASNPFRASSFNSSGIRTFGFTFKFISQSAEEAVMARKIENAFRKFMMPDGQLDSATVVYPPIWEIRFMNGESVNPYMPKLIQSYCTGLNATYNATSSSFHADGSPVEIDLTVNFQEIRATIRSDLYDADSLEATPLQRPSGIAGIKGKISGAIDTAKGAVGSITNQAQSAATSKAKSIIKGIR
jgi:hypothetical protein